jgi:uncharacterized membrane protein (DUF4010 family)
VNHQLVVFHDFDDRIESRRGLAFGDGFLCAAKARLFVAQGDGLYPAHQIRKRGILNQVIQGVAVGRTDQLNTTLGNGPRRQRLFDRPDLVNDDDFRHVIFHGLDHDCMLARRVCHLHASRTADGGVRDITIAGDFVRGIDHDDTFLQIVCQHACDLAQLGGLANARPAQQQEAVSRLDQIADQVNRPRHGAAHAQGQADDIAAAVANGGDPVQGPFDSGAIVGTKVSGPFDDVVQLFPCHGLPGEIQGLVGESRLGCATQIHDDLQERCIGQAGHSILQALGQAADQEMEVVGEGAFVHDVGFRNRSGDSPVAYMGVHGARTSIAIIIPLPRVNARHNPCYRPPMDTFLNLGVSLAIGLLIGIERGWQERAAPDGSRVAGIRTFGLLGFLGGLWALLGRELGPLLTGAAFVSVAALLIVAHIADTRVRGSVGITTSVAALVTFALGALAVLGYGVVAAGGAVVTTTLLSLKPLLHGWLRKLEQVELQAALKLLVMTVVLLPVLPNRGYGPWQALNPFEIWWMVVLIALISFSGYVAVRLLGVKRGMLATGVFGGLVSSTATTVNLARRAAGPVPVSLLAAGIVIACSTMFPRMLIEISVVNIDLLSPLLWPLVVMAGVGLATALWFAFLSRGERLEGAVPLRNPLELRPALEFGLLLALIMLAAEAARHFLGEHGLYLLAALSGTVDVDAITLSVARLARDTGANGADVAIVLAALSNTLVKASLAAFLGGRQLAIRVIPALLAIAGSGIATLWLLS